MYYEKTVKTGVVVMKQKNRQLFVGRFISLLTAFCMTLCMIITPTTVFAANNGEMTITCQENAVTGGDIYYKLGGTGDFVKVDITDNNYDPITLDDSTASITIKIQANTDYQLDTVRGVALRVNGVEYAATADDLTALVADLGFTYNLTALLGESAVSESSFELEFGFVTDDGGEIPPASDGNFRFTCQGDPNGGTVSYKTNTAADYTPLDFGEGKSAAITLGDEDTSITIKIEPNTENDYLLDTDRGVILRVDGNEKFTANGDDVSEFTSGYTFDLSSYIGDSKISESTFELEFEIKNQNGGGSGFRPYEGEYSGTKVDNVPLTVTGNVDFCINDSELFNITSENTMNLTCDYTYDESGYVDFYVQWRLDNRYTSIVINGTDYYSQLPTPDTPEGRQALLDACKGQLNEFKLTVPYSESYTVSGTVKELDESDNDYWQIGNFLWFYNETSRADEDDLILNGKMELVGITFNDEPFEQTEYFKWDDDGENGGEAVLPAGAVITVKIIPEYGYQLTSFGVNGFGFGTGEEQSVFTFEVEQGNFHLGASITKVEDKVKSGSEAVTDGNIQLGDGEIDTGSVVLSVETAGDENRSDFEDELANYNDLNGYTIDSILDINLNQVLYKGNTTDFWETPLNDLSSEAEISLDLADNFNNVVVLHQNHDGSFEILPTTFEDGKVTFNTDSFSKFALAVEEMNTDHHTHSYATIWSYDNTYHWHECSCGNKTDVARHVSNGGIATVQPTAYTTGVRTYSCIVCGYVLRTETIPATVYNNDYWYPTYPTYVPPVITTPSVFTTAPEVEAEVNGSTVTIKWNKVDKAEKYYIYQYKNGKYVKVKTTADTSVTFKKLKNGETYKFLVRYTINGKLSPTSYSSKFTVKVYYKPIPKPTATKNSIKLSWDAVPEAKKYAVYKYVDGKAVKLTETKSLSVKIGKLSPDTEYKYIVRAYIDGKWTTMLKSDIVTVKTNTNSP